MAGQVTADTYTYQLQRELCMTTETEERKSQINSAHLGQISSRDGSMFTMTGMDLRAKHGGKRQIILANVMIWMSRSDNTKF